MDSLEASAPGSASLRPLLPCARCTPQDVDRKKVTGPARPMCTSCGGLLLPPVSRHALSPAGCFLLPGGTTSDEVLHREIISWTRLTRGIHRSAFKLKLQILTLGKLLARHLACCYPPARQTSGMSSWPARWQPTCGRRRYGKHLLPHALRTCSL